MNDKQINVGIIGCGVIGMVLKQWVEKNNPDCKTFVYDPPKGQFDDLSTTDIVFISIHIPTEEDHTQDLSLLCSLIDNCPNVPIFIRTTLVPGSCDRLSKTLNKNIYFMPEFLTERTAYDDFCSQPMIYTGQVELLKRIFKNKEYITMSNLEAEITKYSHNVFGALKVTYFNGIYELAKMNNCDYEKIRKGILLSGYINETHTKVPGPDGKTGYGGKCFPKDVAAFVEVCKNNNIHIYGLLEKLEIINRKYRGD